METIIVDDEPKAIEMLSYYLGEYFPKYEVLETYTSLNEALRGILNKRPEVLFLDINMPKGTGIELLEKIKHLDICTVFLTAHSEYAIDAIKLDAFDYLLKPINLDELNRVNQKIEYFFSTKKADDQEKIKIHISNNIYVFEPDEIIMASSEGNYTTIISTAQKPIILSRNLKKIQEEYLSSAPFFRCHQSFIVNTNHVIHFSNYEIVLINDHKAQLSNKKHHELSQKIR